MGQLEQASATPETEDLLHLWQELEATIGPLPQEQRWQTAGNAIAQIVKVFALRCDLILSAWEEAHNDHGPAVDEDAIAGLVRQTMNLDLAELMEQPVPEQRRPQSPSTASVAGLVDKVVLLEAFNSEIEAVEAEARAKSAVMAVAHDEDVVGWSGAIVGWMEQNNPGEAISLVQLQQELGMPLVEVWLGLLLSHQQYEWEQQGDFYEVEGICLKGRKAH